MVADLRGLSSSEDAHCSGSCNAPIISAMEKPHLLVADDKPDILSALRLLLKRDYRLTTLGRPVEVTEALKAEQFDLALLDMNFTRDTTSGAEGLALLDQVRETAPDLPVIVMTAYANVALAVEALRRGARDFIEKPWQNQRLLQVLSNQLEMGRLRRENQALRAAERSRFVAKSAVMQPIIAMIEKVAPTDVAVLITGEHGTGKGEVARLIHDLSPRAGKPLVNVNTGAVTDSLFESELFGHVKGAFTDASRDREGRFQAAHGGTLFLDEIGNISAAVQAKLLRVIESGEFEAVGSSRTKKADVRLISATNADLRHMVREGRFREDLLFRLNTFHIHLPPLRERREDLLPLVHHFLEKHGQRLNRRNMKLGEKAIEAIQQAGWQGNVRQLDHAVQRALIMNETGTITAADLGLQPGTHGKTSPLDNLTLEQAEIYLIRRALERSGANMTEAARILGIGRSSLYRRLEKFGIDIETGAP